MQKKMGYTNKTRYKKKRKYDRNKTKKRKIREHQHEDRAQTRGTNDKVSMPAVHRKRGVTSSWPCGEDITHHVRPPIKDNGALSEHSKPRESQSHAVISPSRQSLAQKYPPRPHSEDNAEPSRTPPAPERAYPLQ